METQHLMIDLLRRWQWIYAPMETHEGSERHGRSVNENDLHEKLKTI
jgi:hypothetical protein